MGTVAVQYGAWRRYIQLVVLAVLVTTIVYLYTDNSIRIWVELNRVFPPRLRHGLYSRFLTGLLAGYLAGWIFWALAVSLAVTQARRARKRGERRPRWVARVLAIAAVYLATVIALEAGAAMHAARARQAAEASAAQSARALLDENIARNGGLTEGAGKEKAVSLLVLGESSARGVPYHDWLSMGQILGWELERVFPDRRVEVDIRAMQGAPLKPNQQILFNELTTRPDAVLIYSGHNEFQSRFAWSQVTAYYPDDVALRRRAAIVTYLGRMTPLCRLIHDTSEHCSIAAEPPQNLTVERIDRPVCSADESAQVVDEFRRRLESMVAYCEELGAVPILVIPPSDDGRFEPTRSILSPTARAAERLALAQEFEKIRKLEVSAPAEARSRYQHFLERQPGFAEAHFRLARLLAASGSRDQASRHFALARDLDGLPLRCPGQLQDVYREIAARHDAVLVDGPAVLGSLCPSGVPDGNVMHDAQHPSLAGYVALAQVALDQLQARRAFGWPDGVAAARIDPDTCAQRAGMDPARWAQVCTRASVFNAQLSRIGHNRSERAELTNGWLRAEGMSHGHAPGARWHAMSGNPSRGAATARSATVLPASSREVAAIKPSSS